MKIFAFSLLFLALTGIVPAASAAPKPSPPPAPAATPSLKPVDATGWTTPRPPYPEAARKEKLAGSVRLRVYTNRRGRVSRAQVVESSGHKELDNATVQYALANWAGPAFSEAVYVQNYAYRR